MEHQINSSGAPWGYLQIKEVGAAIPRHWTPTVSGEFFLNPVRPYIFCRSSAYLRYFWLSFINTLTRRSERNFAIPLSFFLEVGYLLDTHSPSHKMLKWVLEICCTSKELGHVSSGLIISIAMGDLLKDRSFLTHRAVNFL